MLKKERLKNGVGRIKAFYFDRFADKHKNEEDEQKVKKLSIIIKADVDGSLETLLNVLETYDSNDRVRLDLVHFEVGQIKKSDLDLAEAFNAAIYCFNLPQTSIELDEENKKEDGTPKFKIKHFNVIYKLFDDMIGELNELSPDLEEEEKVGEAEVLKLFDYQVDKSFIKVVGGKCLDGLLQSKAEFKLVRNNQVLIDSLKCKTLKQVKTDVSMIKKGNEFGISFDRELNDAQTPKAGDKIVCYNKKTVKTKIAWNLGF